MNVTRRRNGNPIVRAACARVSRTGDFTGDAGLKLRWSARGGSPTEVHRRLRARFGRARFVRDARERPAGNAGAALREAWPERMNKSDVSPFCLDHQGHGRGERGGGRAVLFSSIGSLGDDFATFCGHVREERPDVPVFIVGTSLGGYVATKAAMEIRRRRTRSS